jgi:Collagen triple helix repeat (20 copies)
MHGVQGETGAAGSPGAPGLPGVAGAIGPPGLQGPLGEVGATGAQGVTGPQGELGLTGPVGPQGETGSEGATGARGLEGVQGEVGSTGLEGPAGPPGAQGVQGEVGPQGTTGAEGAQGPAGAAGATGATGPAGSSGLSQYAYIYNLGGETVPLEADVTFDTNGVLTPGITHAPGVAGITLTTAGTYEATFSVSGTEPSQMALFVNGILVPGTIYGSGAGTQQNVGQAIFIAPAGAVLTVRNHTSSAAVGLATPIGGTQASANASVVIEKLA